MSLSKQVRTTSDLRETLIDIIGDVRNGRVKANDAAVIAKVAQVTLNSVLVDLQAAKFVQEHGGTIAAGTQLVPQGSSRQLGVSAKPVTPDETLRETLFDYLVAAKKPVKPGLIAADLKTEHEVILRLLDHEWFVATPDGYFIKK